MKIYREIRNYILTNLGKISFWQKTSLLGNHFGYIVWFDFML